MSNKLSTQPYRGTRDFLPEEMSVRLQVFARLYSVIESFGYVRYDGPVLEPIEIYEAKSGQELVNEQLYSLIDRGDRRLALRPEMTPTVARMIAANRKNLTFPVRWYSHPNCFRYERPQRGRVREHWQVNVDMFGSEAAGAEAELFTLIHTMMAGLGARPDQYLLRVSDRSLVQKALQGYAGVKDEQVRAVFGQLDRWEKVPVEASREVLAGAGLDAGQISRVEEIITLSLEAIADIAGAEATAASPVAQVITRQLLDHPVKFDPLITRGFEYYTSTVFEVFDTSPENRRALFGGGRYDNLAGLFSDERIPGIGFGMGDVTLINFLETHGLLPKANVAAEVDVIAGADALLPGARQVLAALRGAGLRATAPVERRGVGKDLKQAGKRGVAVVVLLQEDEWARGAVIVRDMRAGQQQEVALADVTAAVQAALAGAATH